MGMDSYLFKQKKEIFDTYMDTLKKVRAIREKNADKIGKAYKKWHDFVVELQEKYPAFKRTNKFKTLARHATKDEICKHDELCEKYEKLCGDDLFNAVDTDPGERIHYWRKPYGLHFYIVDHFDHAPGCDNCERIPLSKDGIDHMLRDMRRSQKNPGPVDNANPFGCDEYWDNDMLKRTIDVFEKTLKEYKDDEQVYYYAWY